jgi:hypothetical protein
VSVDEWGEYIAYSGDRIRIGRSYRIYDGKGELVSTGIEWEEVERRPDMDEEREVEKARKRLDEKIEKIREKVREKRGEQPSPST